VLSRAEAQFIAQNAPLYNRFAVVLHPESYGV